MIDSIRQSLIPLNNDSTKSSNLRCAAVLIPLFFNKENKLEVIFTRRAEHLKHHPGQISFPGGGFEKNDNDLSKTAIRETYEEIGIQAEKIELIGRLPQQETISQYNITPFVGVVDSNYQLAIDSNEVAEVFTVPFDFVTDLTNHKKQTESFNGKQFSFYVIQYKHYNIWGATARILVNFSRRLNRN